MEFKDHQGKRLFLLGVNYWPASSGLNMWTEWNPDELSADIQRMKELGMNCCRPFLFMPAFVSDEKGVDPEMLERLDFFLTLCDNHDLYTLPSFIVGHMSGEDWEAPWSRGKDFISDKTMIAITHNYLRTVVQAVKAHPSIIAWLLSNELPNYIGNQPPEAVTNWVREMIGDIKGIDPARPVSIGDGAWSPEITGESSGFLLRKLNQYQDFVGLHYYPRSMSPWRHSYTTAFRITLAREWQRPVIVEEFGTSTTLCSEDNQASYYRNVFYSALINGAQGTLSWCLNDFDFTDKRPYSHHTFEERFGVVRTDKSLKPAAREFAEFAAIATELTDSQYRRIDASAGCLLPSNYYYRYPYPFEPDFDQWYNLYLETFSIMKRANLNIRCLYEPARELEHDGAQSHELVLDPEQTPVLFIPRLKLLQKATHYQLMDYVNRGGVLYFSFANDSWVLNWSDLAGVTTDCKFGVPDFYNGNQIRVEVREDWGCFKKGATFNVPLLQTDPEYAYCPVVRTSGKILMTDSYGFPFLIENAVGRGTVYFCSFPIEILALASRADSWKKALGQIYRSIYYRHCPEPPIAIEGDGLEMGIWETDDSYRLVIFNHSWKEERALVSIHLPAWKIEGLSVSYERIDNDKIAFFVSHKRACSLTVVKH